MNVYIVIAHKESKMQGYIDTKYSFNLAAYKNEEDAQFSVKRMVDRYLTDSAYTIHSYGDNFVEYSLKGFEFDRFKYTYEIETHALL